ncbi:pimeloyl-ACP methyl ester carboxylesterase [Streptomyces sp. V4I23]|uniref:alpha/beta hydrolase n=1 Tax=Streptomyces sp. V4I23 TaxID=3042282 RepID=UPI00278527E9|nr:alpha/beta hydrolase [Streptomyces sp. V4I23]MDQ1009998.1 pimeloyl-ACP methyl ester carboxylesterase [Streptomyces sp. V4I23]
MTITRTFRRRPGLTVALTLPALATALVAVPQPAEATGRPDTAIQWGPCSGKGLDPRQECGTVPVPLDHADPHGPRISLAVSRIRSEKLAARRGTLLLVPGGPGNPGLHEPSRRGMQLPLSVRDAYDIVSFDPRGVGRSAPVSCGLAHDDLAMERLRPWPAPDGSADRNMATARRLADACAANGGDVLPTISTRNEARDIDRIRAALGEDKLSAWGVSYGTYAGAVFAQMFPHRTDRWVLDSNDDPDAKRVARGWLANYAVGVEDSFPNFAAWAADPANEYRLAETPEEVRPMVLALAARLDREPIPWPDANPEELNGNVLRQTLLDSLYSPKRFPVVARLIAAARDGLPLPPPHTVPDEVMQNTVAASAATLCNDVDAWSGDSQTSYEKDVAVSRKRHPLTAGMPVNVMPCAFWDLGPTEPATRITPHGPSNVLLVQNARDVATPLAGAKKMRAAFGDRARMVVVDAVGHGAYVDNGNACGDATVTRFLLTGQRPGRDVYCAS